MAADWLSPDTSLAAPPVAGTPSPLLSNQFLLCLDAPENAKVEQADEVRPESVSLAGEGCEAGHSGGSSRQGRSGGL